MSIFNIVFTKYMRGKLVFFVQAVCFMVLLSGCSILDSPTEGTVIDPPMESVRSPLLKSNPTTQKKVNDDRRTTVYFLDRYSSLVPVSVMLPNHDRLAKHAMNALVKGNDAIVESELPHGFRAPLPVGTTIRSLDYSPQQKHLRLDLSEKALTYHEAEERQFLEAIVWTMTELPGIDSVALSIEGQAIKEMPLHGTPVDDKLTRAIGINLDHAHTTIPLAQTKPVILYFQRHANENLHYFVPVTRFVERAIDPTQAVIQQLIAGPGLDTNLEAVLPSSLSVETFIRENSSVRLDLRELPQLAADAITLSLAELDTEATVEYIDEKGEVRETMARPQQFNIISK